MTCHNARDERKLHLLGFRAEGRQNLLVRLRIGDAQVENLTDILFANDTTLLTCHSTEICQTHIFWGFGMTGACTEGERFKARKLDSHTLAIETCNILGRCHNAEGYQAYIICESSCQGKGRLLFEVPRLGLTTRKIDSCTL